MAIQFPPQQPYPGAYPMQGMSVPGAAIQTQPGMPGVVATGMPPGNWMMRPAPIPGCPPGLEYLTQIDQLLVQQQTEILEAVTGYEQANKYRVFNNVGQQCYYAFEESSLCMRLCCGTHREFIIHIVDNMNQEVLRIFRPFKCCANGGCCCLDCCHFEIKVESPSGQVLGYARSICACCGPRFVILNENRELELEIEGPCCIFPACPCDQEFNLQNREGVKIGKITKQWAGFAREVFTDADNFGVSFPRDLDVRMKATMLGVLFLIDFMFFEKSGNGRRRD